MNGDRYGAGNKMIAGGIGISYDASGMSDESNASTPEAATQLVIGCIGTGDQIYEKLTEIFKRRGLSWTRVAKQLAMSRQALIRAVKADRVPYRQLERVCSVVDSDPFELFEIMPPDGNKRLM